MLKNGEVVNYIVKGSQGEEYVKKCLESASDFYELSACSEQASKQSEETEKLNEAGEVEAMQKIEKIDDLTQFLNACTSSAIELNSSKLSVMVMNFQYIFFNLLSLFSCF